MVNHFNEIKDDAKKAELMKFAAQISQNPLQVRLLSDRVYELLIDDLRQQQERFGRNYEARL